MATFIDDDTHNVRLCLAGNANAFEPLVRRYQNAAFAVALGYLRDRADAEDVVQDAFVSAFCKLSQLKDPAVFGSWFHRIVVNRCKEWVRRKRVSRLVHVDPDAEHIRDELPLADRIHRKYIENLEIWDEVEQLPEHYRQVVMLYYYTGFTLKETAAFLDIPESTARGRLYQSRIRLRRALSPQEKETIAMSQIDVTEDVQDVVCRIAKEDFEETIDMGDVENIVLYCGVNTEVEIHQAKGNQLQISGSKIGLGFSDEDARGQMTGFTISSDRTDDFYNTGPHEGELFLGVESDKGHRWAKTRRISEHWKRDLINSWMLYEVSDGIRLIDLFPQLKEDIDVAPPLLNNIRSSLGRAIRVTVHTSKVQPMDMKRSAMSEEIEGLFEAMQWDNTSVFGPSAYCHLSISVPDGKNVSLFRPNSVTAENVNASLMVYSSPNVSRLSDIGRDVYLFNSAFSEIQGIGGLFHQRLYSYGGGIFHEDVMENCDFWEGKIESVNGDVEIDVGRYELNAKDLKGKVTIYNRYGTTRLQQSTRESDARCDLRTVSGNIRLSLSKSVAEKTSLVMHSLCGSFKYGNARDIMSLYRTQSVGHWLTLSSMGKSFANADFAVLTESGRAEIEVLDESEL